MSKYKKLTVKDLRPAAYNPRVITKTRLEGLANSYDDFGDLSGVVFNATTKTLISGHQRLKTVSGKNTKIVVQQELSKPDKFGTVALGYVVVTTAKGNIHLPLRIVQWSDKKAEKAANIAANAHGGEFDKAKLAKLVAELERGKFQIERTGLDPMTLRTLPKIGEASSPDISASKNGKGLSFQEFEASTTEKGLKHTCPRCQYQF